MLSQKFRFFSLVICLCGLSTFSSSCVREDRFPDIGQQFAGPTDVASSNDGSHFYVLNSDADRNFNTGSILVLDAAGEKITAQKTPRLGRSLDVAGDVLIATYGGDDEEENSLQIFDLSDPAKPTLAKTFELPRNCIPVNTVIRENYRYFAMTCSDPDVDTSNGSLYIGDLDLSELSNTQIHHVRNLYNTRRALHIDPSRGALIAFPSDPKKENSSDFIAEDHIAFDIDSGNIEVDQSNEVPDTFESSAQTRERVGTRRLYQMLVYDINAAADDKFPFLEINNPKTNVEYRWIYYSGTNIDGLPDPGDTSFADPKLKYYRTNFWASSPDPDSPDAFYISHRNRPSRALHANDVLKVSITGDLLQKDAAAIKDLAPSSDYLNFERVYGFNGREAQSWHYPGDIDVKNVLGSKVIFINHFRDLLKWDRKSVAFGITVKDLDQSGWFKEVTDTSAFSSYYQRAVNQDGVIMSCSFYGNAVIRLAVKPGADTIDIKRIE